MKNEMQDPVVELVSKGFSVIFKIAAIMIVSSLAVGGFIVYVAIHFIHKVW